MQIDPYLTFNGNCREAFTFYEKVLGGKIQTMVTFGETPGGDHHGPEFHDKIMHTRLLVGDQVLMASDAPAGHSRPMQGFAVSINVETPAEAERIFAALSEGANVMMPMQQTFWAQRFGMLTDRFGTPWMVNCEEKKS